MTETAREQATHRLMKEVLDLKEQRFIDSARITAIATKLNIDDIEKRIYFLRELLAIVRRFPLKIYSDDQARQRMIIAIQEALDIAIDEEEDELD